MNTIHIIMEGGIIQAILNIPPDTEVVVRDYDVDGVDYDSEVCGHVCGDRCTEVHWTDDEDLGSNAVRDQFEPMTEVEWGST